METPAFFFSSPIGGRGTARSAVEGAGPLAIGGPIFDHIYRCSGASVNTTKRALIATTVLITGTVSAALAVPVPGDREGPLSRDCQLLAQALHESYSYVFVVASDQKCDWHRLGLSDAVDIDSLPPYDGSNFVASKTAEGLRYSLWGTRAEVVVGSQVAELSGQGDLCTYQRLFGRWHRSGCVNSWVS